VTVNQGEEVFEEFSLELGVWVVEVKLGDLHFFAVFGEGIDACLDFRRRHGGFVVTLEADAVERCVIIDEEFDPLVVVFSMLGVVVGEDGVVVDVGEVFITFGSIEPFEDDVFAKQIHEFVFAVWLVHDVPFLEGVWVEVGVFFDVFDEVFAEGLWVFFVEVVAVWKAGESGPDEDVSADGDVVFLSPCEEFFEVVFHGGVETPFHSVCGGDFAACFVEDGGVLLFAFF